MSTFVINPTGEQEKIVTAFFEALDISFVSDNYEKLPPHVLAGIEKGREDLKAGRSISYEDFKKKYPVK